MHFVKAAENFARTFLLKWDNLSSRCFIDEIKSSVFLFRPSVKFSFPVPRRPAKNIFRNLTEHDLKAGFMAENFYRLSHGRGQAGSGRQQFSKLSHICPLRSKQSDPKGIFQMNKSGSADFSVLKGSPQTHAKDQAVVYVKRLFLKKPEVACISQIYTTGMSGARCVCRRLVLCKVLQSDSTSTFIMVCVCNMCYSGFLSCPSASSSCSSLLRPAHPHLFLMLLSQGFLVLAH